MIRSLRGGFWRLGDGDFFCVLFRSCVDALLMLFFLRSTKPGAARQPLTFLASPRKVSKRRRPLGRSPFGVPGAGRHKSGRENNSLRSDIFPFLIRFAPAVTGYSQADFETGSLRIARGQRWLNSLQPHLLCRSNASWNPAFAGTTD